MEQLDNWKGRIDDEPRRKHNHRYLSLSNSAVEGGAAKTVFGQKCLKTIVKLKTWPLVEEWTPKSREAARKEEEKQFQPEGSTQRYAESAG